MALTQRQIVFVRGRAAEVWAALTEGPSSRQYYFGSMVESSFEVGASIRYLVQADPEDTPHAAIEGEIVACEAERELVHGFRFCDLDDPATVVRWRIDPTATEGVMRVELEHAGFEAENQTWARVSSGWPMILSGLKTWLETGTPLGLLGGG